MSDSSRNALGMALMYGALSALAWIVGGFAFCVMFAVDGCPLTCVLRSGEPQPEPEEVFESRIQLQRPMRRIAMQIDRNRDDGHMSHRQRDRYYLPDGKVEQTVVPHRLLGPREDTREEKCNRSIISEPAQKTSRADR